MTDADRAKARALRAAELKRAKAGRPEPVAPAVCSACWRSGRCIGAGCPIMPRNAYPQQHVGSGPSF